MFIYAQDKAKDASSKISRPNAYPSIGFSFK